MFRKFGKMERCLVRACAKRGRTTEEEEEVEKEREREEVEEEEL